MFVYLFNLFVCLFVGLSVSLALAVVFVLNRNTPVMRASGVLTTGTLFVGVILEFLAPFVYLAPPTFGLTCVGIRVLPGLLMTLCNAALLTRVVVIQRCLTIIHTYSFYLLIIYQTITID